LSSWSSACSSSLWMALWLVLTKNLYCDTMSRAISKQMNIWQDMAYTCMSVVWLTGNACWWQLDHSHPSVSPVPQCIMWHFTCQSALGSFCVQCLHILSSHNTVLFWWLIPMSFFWEKEGIHLSSPIVPITCIKTPFSPVVFLNSYNFVMSVLHYLSWCTEPVPMHCSRLMSYNKRFTYLLSY